MIAELVSRSGRSLGDLVKDRFAAFPSSGEANFRVKDPMQAINRVLHAFSAVALSVDKADGVSMTFSDWRFNLRRSNTEPLVRLNVESKGGHADEVEAHAKEIADLLGGIKV